MNNIIDLGKGVIQKKQKRNIYKQSANSLFNFMKKPAHLEEILIKKCLYPRYCEENISYLGNPSIKKIAFPMKCFCDIYLNKLASHMYIYGKYGIGLNKEWGINNKVQPIQYINKKSKIVLDFKKSLKYCLSNRCDVKMKNTVLHNLKFMKPLQGNMARDNKNIRCIFHDEKEWRFVPNITEHHKEIKSLIYNDLELTQVHYNKYSEIIKTIPELCLSIEYSDIKYLIVESDNDRVNLINVIMKKCVGTDEEKYILISKILVFDELKEDW